MPTQVGLEQKETIFKQSSKKGEECWFVRVTCNVLEARIYGPFPSRQDALRFREGAEFELRKLLDFQLPGLTGEVSFSPPQKN